MARADQPLHLHVLAGEIEDRGIAALLHPDGLARVGDDLAAERHAHALLRGLRIDAMLPGLLVAGSGVTSRRFQRTPQITSSTTTGPSCARPDRCSARASPCPEP